MIGEVEKKAASVMMSYLFERQPGRYGGQEEKSIIEDAVQRRIRAIAQDIADEVIAAVPDIRTRIRARIVTLVERAMADDPWIEEHLAEAIALGLRKVAKLEIDS
jgi:hypothetical protein